MINGCISVGFNAYSCCFVLLFPVLSCQLSVHLKHLSDWLNIALISALPPGKASSLYEPSVSVLPSDLTELQVAVSDVNGRYDGLGRELKERLSRQQASLELRQKARQGTDELKKWLSDRENSLKLGQTASPSKPEVVRAQAQENKVKASFNLRRSLKTVEDKLEYSLFH